MSGGPVPVLYHGAAKDLARGALDLERVPLKMMLAGPEYEPDLERHESFADVRDSEIPASGGYRAGGTRLTRDSDNYIRPVRWKDMTADIRYGIWFRADTGALVMYLDFGPQRIERGGFQVGLPADDPSLPLPRGRNHDTIEDELAALLGY